jgi:hypothetical protein
MQKRTVAKLGGFVAAAALTAGLVAYSAGATGAYFTSSKSGTINGSVGTVNINNVTPLDITFNNLLPGEYQTDPITYNVKSSSGLVDVYLEIDHAAALQDPSATGDNPLGRYGHFAVQADAGAFSSFNTAAARVGTPATDANTCKVDAYGRNSTTGDIQTTAALNTTDPAPKWCPVPQFILLSYGAKATDPEATAQVTFGFTGLLGNAAQGASLGEVDFKILAVQHTISPYTNQPNA